MGRSKRIDAALRVECARILAKYDADLKIVEDTVSRMRSLPNKATPEEVVALYAGLDDFKRAVGSVNEGGRSGLVNLTMRLREAITTARDQIEREDAQAAASAKAAEDARLAKVAAKDAARAEAARIRRLLAEHPEEFE